jgi:hypothetical protein
MFTKDSLTIQKYLEKSSKISKNGFKELKLLYDSLKKVKYDYELINTINNDNKNNKHFSNPFVSDEILHSIKSLNNNLKLILKINNNILTINIYYNNHNLKKFVSNIIIVISFIFHLMNKNVGNVNINYYITDHKKIIDKDIKDGLNYGHINNGCCNPATNTIDIWRIEEIMKVTIHELFHLFNCDKSMNDDYNIINMYKNRYNINSDRVNTFEAYTEIWANILNCFLLSNNEYKNFVKYINLEKSWANIQAYKIFYLTNLDKKETVDINKYTNVLAYFIIRCEIYNNFKDFIKLFSKNVCNNSKVYFEFLQNVNKLISKDEFIKKISKKNYIYKSLRMSAMEIKLF